MSCPVLLPLHLTLHPRYSSLALVTPLFGSTLPAPPRLPSRSTCRVPSPPLCMQPAAPIRIRPRPRAAPNTHRRLPRRARATRSIQLSTFLEAIPNNNFVFSQRHGSLVGVPRARSFLRPEAPPRSAEIVDEAKSELQGRSEIFSQFESREPPIFLDATSLSFRPRLRFDAQPHPEFALPPHAGAGRTLLSPATAAAPRIASATVLSLRLASPPPEDRPTGVCAVDCGAWRQWAFVREQAVRTTYCLSSLLLLPSMPHARHPSLHATPFPLPRLPPSFFFTCAPLRVHTSTGPPPDGRDATRAPPILDATRPGVHPAAAHDVRRPGPCAAMTWHPLCDVHARRRLPAVADANVPLYEGAASRRGRRGYRTALGASEREMMMSWRLLGWSTGSGTDEGPSPSRDERLVWASGEMTWQRLDSISALLRPSGGGGRRRSYGAHRPREPHTLPGLREVDLVQACSMRRTLWDAAVLAPDGACAESLGRGVDDVVTKPSYERRVISWHAWYRMTAPACRCDSRGAFLLPRSSSQRRGEIFHVYPRRGDDADRDGTVRLASASRTSILKMAPFRGGDPRARWAVALTLEARATQLPYIPVRGIRAQDLW
ncbi:hypothetical protein DFH09DRAFT_1319345 [Mycena vulgaris]|nr:hypothetical protein DFH09DRAFT_1319345 [Mycena vulgaris]